MPSDLYKRRKNPRNIAQQTKDRPRLKKVQQKKVTPMVPPIIGSMLCSCKSGKTYEFCCQQSHIEGLHQDCPEAVLRARYTAYKHGLAEFIFQTTHPKNSDYDKYLTMDFSRDERGRKKWGKDIMYDVSLHS